MTEPEQPTPADQAREHLTTIRKAWRHVLDPIATDRAGSTRSDIRPATEDELETLPDARLDTPRTLAFWVHATIEEWPVTMKTLQPDAHGKLQLVTTDTIDCSNIYAMVDFLHREAERITEWTEPGHDYGATFIAELEALAKVVSRVAWPPKGDRITIGDCPTCGRRLRVKAPQWIRRPIHVPQPTTDPAAYAEWTWWVPEGAVWEPTRDAPITCRCGVEDTLQGWRERLAGPSLPLTAEQLVADIREQLGMRYGPATVRQWARRGMIEVVGYSAKGHALYDRTQTLAALMARESKREQAS